MHDTSNTYLEWCSASIGQLVDRSIGAGDILGYAWLIDEKTAVTCAHLLVPYQNHLPALTMRFPASGMQLGIEEVSFHAQFDEKQAAQLHRRGQTTAMALQNQNVALLKPTENIAPLTDQFKDELNETLSLSAPAGDKAISGSLEELDLALVVQTLANARKQGTLTICDARNRPVARLFCRDGKVLHAHFGDLQNETAVYQFVSQNMKGRFYFQAKNEPEWAVEGPIARPTDMLLIEAHRRLDEIPKLLLDLDGEEARYKRTVQQPSVNGEHKSCVEALWPLLDGRTSVGQLWRATRLDDYTIFSALTELLRARNIVEVDATDLVGPEPRVLDVAPDMPLAPWDEITTVTVESAAWSPTIKKGYLLGTLRPGDPWHLLHNVELRDNCAGLPLFKSNKVIGIHSGALPADPKATAVTNLKQLIWVESAYECLKQDFESAAVQQRVTAAGCTELASVDCPNCGSSYLDSARFCKRCGTPLIGDFSVEDEEQSGKRPRGKIIAAVALFVLLIVAADFAWLFFNSIPNAVPTEPITIASVELAVPDSGQWREVSDLTVHNGELIRLQFTQEDDAHIYVLMRGTSSSAAQLLYPESAAEDVPLPKDRKITIPRDPPPAAGVKTVSMSGLTVYGQPGTEQILIISSKSQADLLKDPEMVAKTFDRAVEIIKRSEPATSVKVQPAALGGNVFPGADENSKEPTVYLNLLNLKHDQ